jgi:MOSC domain-containing protein YiiM
MPTDGIFCKVLVGGKIRVGDKLKANWIKIDL